MLCKYKVSHHQIMQTTYENYNLYTSIKYYNFSFFFFFECVFYAHSLLLWPSNQHYCGICSLSFNHFNIIAKKCLRFVLLKMTFVFIATNKHFIFASYFLHPLQSNFIHSLNHAIDLILRFTGVEIKFGFFFLFFVWDFSHKYSTVSKSVH